MFTVENSEKRNPIKYEKFFQKLSISILLSDKMAKYKIINIYNTRVVCKCLLKLHEKDWSTIQVYNNVSSLPFICGSNDNGSTVVVVSISVSITVVISSSIKEFIKIRNESDSSKLALSPKFNIF